MANMPSQVPRRTCTAGLHILLMLVVILSLLNGITAQQRSMQEPHRKLLNDVVAPPALFTGLAKTLATSSSRKTIQVLEPPPLVPTEGSSGALTAVVGPITIKVTWDFSGSGPWVVNVEVSVNFLRRVIPLGNSTVNITEPGNVTFGVVGVAAVQVICNPGPPLTVTATVTLGNRVFSVTLVKGAI